MPRPALSNLLACVPLQQRLASCALVCSSWAEAAIAATNSIVLPEPSNGHVVTADTRLPRTDVASLQEWAQQHGSRLTKLHVDLWGQDVAAAAGEWLKLPCPNLQDLLLQSCTLGKGSQVCSNIAAATGLTSLVLDEITLPGPAGASKPCCSVLDQLLSAITSLQKLRQLKLGVFRCPELQPEPHSDAVGHSSLPMDLVLQLPARFMQQLQQLPLLTLLQLGQSATATSLAYLSSLTRLKHLEVSSCSFKPAGCLQGLQQLQTLTQLVLADVAGNVCTLAPGVSTLTSLQHLQLLGWGSPMAAAGPLQLPATLSAADIASMTRLQQLVLCNVCCTRAASAAHGKVLELLAVLGQLQHLTELVLEAVQGLQGCPLQAFSALTASSNLQRLCLSDVALGSLGPAAVAPGSAVAQHRHQSVWQYVFPAGSQCPNLADLRLESVRPGLQADDMQHLAQCCPSIQVLVASLQPAGKGAQLTMLQELPRLQQLALEGGLHPATTGVLAQLTGLQHLAVRSVDITDMDVVQLTPLKQLTVLDLSGCSLSNNLWRQLSPFTPLARDGGQPSCLLGFGLYEGFYNKVSNQPQPSTQGPTRLQCII